MYVISEEDYLQHHGILGMHWGIRKEEPSLPKIPRTKEQNKALLKKAVITTGVILSATAITAGKIYMDSQKNKQSSAPSASSVSHGETFVNTYVQQPRNLILLNSDRFTSDGGLNDPLPEFEKGISAFDKANHTDTAYRTEPGMIRYGDRSEKIYANIPDPYGRKDRSGRPINHQVVIPQVLSIGINSFDDVKTKIWPIMETQYQLIEKRNMSGLTQEQLDHYNHNRKNAYYT